MSWQKLKNFLLALLVLIHTTKFTLIYFQAQYRYTTEYILFPMYMNKPSKKNLNLWLILKNAVLWKGSHHVWLYLKRMAVSDKSLTHGPFTNALPWMDTWPSKYWYWTCHKGSQISWPILQQDNWWTCHCVLYCTKWILSHSMEQDMVVPLTKWYHSILAHPRCKHSRMTRQAWYYHPNKKDRSTSFIANIGKVLISLAEEVDCFPKMILPTPHGMKSPLILLDHGLKNWKI